MNEDLTIKAISAYNANLHRGMTAALEAVVAMVLEEAAKVADEYGAFDHKLIADAEDDEERAAFERGAFKGRNIAAAIRALKEKPNG